MSAAFSLAPVLGGPLSADELPVGATLTILADPVEVASAGSGNFFAATVGQSLHTGDVVRTGSSGVALVTFFDGSESQLGTDSELQIEQADYSPAPQIALFQTSGVSVNRVIPLPPGGNFRTDTPDATGIVRGTSYVVSVGSDASIDGTSLVLLTDRDGHVGHVQVVPAQAQEQILDLVKAGDLGKTSRASVATSAQPQAAVASHLEDATLATIEQAARNLHDVDAAHLLGEQVRVAAHLVVAAALPPRLASQASTPATSAASVTAAASTTSMAAGPGSSSAAGSTALSTKSHSTSTNGDNQSTSGDANPKPKTNAAPPLTATQAKS